MISFSPPHTYRWTGKFEDRNTPRQAGFDWVDKQWITHSPYVAYLLYNESDKKARNKLTRMHRNVLSSLQRDDALTMLDIPAPRGEDYLPFQRAGIEHLVQQFQSGRTYIGCLDAQGLGKTIQAIGVANVLNLRQLMIVCPAGLRLNWARELEKWHMWNPGIISIETGRTKPGPGKTHIVSYELAHVVKDVKPDLIIVDECAKLKTPTTSRTVKLLGNKATNFKGLVHNAPTIFLSGTPIPNGRPTESWPILHRCAPDVISGASMAAFTTRFCRTDWEGKIVGVKRAAEFYARLRGSGFMLRRLKENVLKDLPPKRYQMVVFPADSRQLKKVLKRERDFNVGEIIEHGVPVGSALPEIRHEMGLAMLPQTISYVKDLLDGGTDKLVIFTHHIDVSDDLMDALVDYNPVILIGNTPQKKRQELVDTFQADPGVRVFIGNEAAEEGITLTAACDVVHVEPEWVPGKNEQRTDRLHRIGQTRGVLVHYLVVEGSIGGKILGASAGKAGNIKRILDR